MEKSGILLAWKRNRISMDSVKGQKFNQVNVKIQLALFHDYESDSIPCKKQKSAPSCPIWKAFTDRKRVGQGIY